MIKILHFGVCFPLMKWNRIKGFKMFNLNALDAFIVISSYFFLSHKHVWVQFYKALTWVPSTMRWNSASRETRGDKHNSVVMNPFLFFCKWKAINSQNYYFGFVSNIDHKLQFLYQPKPTSFGDEKSLSYNRVIKKTFFWQKFTQYCKFH